MSGSETSASLMYHCAVMFSFSYFVCHLLFPSCHCLLFLSLLKGTGKLTCSCRVSTRNFVVRSWKKNLRFYGIRTLMFSEEVSGDGSDVVSRLANLLAHEHFYKSTNKKQVVYRCMSPVSSLSKQRGLKIIREPCVLFPVIACVIKSVLCFLFQNLLHYTVIQQK